MNIYIYIYTISVCVCVHIYIYIYIYLLPPHILVHPYILFYSIYSTPVHTIYFIFPFIILFCLFILTYVYFFILILFLLSVCCCCCCCCCLCILEACDTKTNSLYAQTYLAIKLFLTSDSVIHYIAKSIGTPSNEQV